MNSLISSRLPHMRGLSFLLLLFFSSLTLYGQVFSSNTTITGTYTATGDVTIQSGATLNILGGTFIMPSERRIVVERGAKLFIDGGLITTNAARWRGIYVLGNKNVDQPFYASTTTTSSDPGIVFLQHGGTISKARTAISTKHPNASSNDSYYGGLVIALDAFFINCRRGVEFMRYDRQNNSRFIGTEFTFSGSGSVGGVTIWATDGIHFDDCLFDGNQKGIVAYNAGCLIENSTIEDGDIGVEVIATSGGESVDIFNNQFSSNYDEDINAEGSGTARTVNVIGNDFSDGDFSIWLTGSIIGIIQENVFNDAVVGTLNTNTGNSKIKVFCNSFNNCGVGVMAEGDCSKLYILNNDFDNISDDILIEEKNGVAGEIGSSQGNYCQPADNCFSASGANDIRTSGTTVTFNYYTPNNVLQSDCKIPALTGGFNTISTCVSKRLSCVNPLQGSGDQYGSQALNTRNNNSNSTQDTQPISTNSSTSIGIQAYPNPTDEWLQISNLPAEGEYMIKLIDLHGRTLKSWQQEGSTQIQLSVNELPTGIFILRVEKGNDILHTQRVMISN